MSKKSPLIGILSMKVCEENGCIIASGYCVTKFFGGKERIDTEQIKIDLQFKEDAIGFSFGSRFGIKLPKGFCLNSYELRVRREEALSFDIQNKLIIRYKEEYLGRFLYRLIDMKIGRNRNRKVFVKDGIAVYYRQNKYNSLVLTVRDANRYDCESEQERIRKAYAVAKKRKNEDIIILFEKNCSRYEESASVLYEKLLDCGCENVYYIVNPDNPRIQNLPEKYRRNLIDKDSDKHLEYFFVCRKFIATETMEHALQLRIANKQVMDKVRSNDIEYVFLQHGPTYMVSLTSDLRTGFRRGEYKLHKTVVSSRLEAEHFVEAAGMRAEDLYITGMAKFDRCYRYDTADRIVIMMTWRRWETNQARENLEETKYYKMTERLYNSVPENLKEKVIILPHPLMADRFKNVSAMGNHVLIADSYDEVLRSCDVLITDYSSISYDAFYRGCKVIFCWEEKDECMEHYGENAYLLLDEESAFGDVCMNGTEITEAINSCYMKPQKNIYREKYRKIIEFNDGKNSERIIECLKKDGIIR